MRSKATTAAPATATRHRKVQRQQDAHDRAAPAAKKPKKRSVAVQAGPRRQPEPPLPRQRLKKPGREADMAQRPQFMAPNYLGSGKLQGMRALITGGDSGIGRAVAVLFAREGADVAIVYLDEHTDAQETQACVEAEGTQCTLIPGNVADPSFCNEAVARAVADMGGLDILVNNAAFQLHAKRIENITDERLALTLQTNIGGYFQMARAAVPHLEEGGCIINTGSVTGLAGSAELIDYSTTKGAIHAFTKALAANLAPRGIRVNAVAPGPVWTPLNPADKQAREVAQFGAKTDMKRPAQPEELSPAYVFLAAPVCSSYITGIVLPVTGSVGAI